MDGHPIDGVQILLNHMNDISKTKCIPKENGYYVLCNLEIGSHSLYFDCEDYQPMKQEINIGVIENTDVETVFMDAKETAPRMKGCYVFEGIVPNSLSDCSLQEVKDKNKDFLYYYAIENKRSTKQIHSTVSKGEKLLSLSHDDMNLMDHRLVIVKGKKGIYEISEYDYVKKAYLLKNELEENISAGDYVNLLSPIKVDAKGHYRILIPASTFAKQEKINFFLADDTNYIMYEIKIADVTRI